jgi:HSP20 family protein
MKFRDLIPGQRGRESSLARREQDITFEGLHREINRLLDLVAGEAGMAPATRETALWGAEIPHVDVSETENEIIVEAELPGIDQKDVEITLAKGVLTIRGEKKQESEEQHKSFFRRERVYGTFQRMIPLSTDVDAEHVAATYRNGVLKVTLPKTAEARSQKKIPIQVTA